MNKFAFISVLAICSCLGLFPSQALALQYLDPSSGPFMVDAPGSTTPKDTFSLNEKPVVFLEFDRDSLETRLPLLVGWKWIVENDTTASFAAKLISDFPKDSLLIWGQANNWDAVKKVGDWQVETSWLNVGFLDLKGGAGSKLINFTVTPEPVSSLLYLAGSAPIAVGLYRRRKKLIP